MYMTSNGQKIQLNQDKKENYTSPSPSPSKPDTSKTWIIAVIVVVAAIFLFFVLKFGFKMFIEGK